MSQQGPPADAKEAQAAALQELEKAQKEKRKIDTTLANLEASIYAFEDSYLQESALSGGNIIKGFDNYLKPPAAINKKKMEVTNEDRLFSTSSGTFAQSIHLKNQLALQTASLSRLARMAVGPPPPAITLLPSLRRNVSNVSNYFDCDVKPQAGMDPSVGQRQVAAQAWSFAHEVDPAKTRISATPTTGSSLDNGSLSLTVPDSSTLGTTTAHSSSTPMTGPPAPSTPNASTAKTNPDSQKDLKSDTDVDMLEINTAAFVEPENAISPAESAHSTRSVSKAAKESRRSQTARGGRGDRSGRDGQGGARRGAGGRAGVGEGGVRGRGGRSQTASTRG